MNIIAIIPAAGKGARFGTPKVDAMYNSVTFSQKILQTLEEIGIAKHLIIRDIDTPDMLASLRWGMQKILSEQENPDGWLIWPVDHPTVKPDTIRILASVFETNSNSVIIPRYQSKNGHPIIVPGFLCIPDKPEPLGLKGIIMQSGFPVKYVNVDDVGILFNFNTPEDVTYV